MHCLKLTDKAKGIHLQEIHSYVAWQKKFWIWTYMTKLRGSATFDVVTAVIVELTVPWVVAPARIAEQVWKPSGRMYSNTSTFIPCREKQFAVLECRRILPVYLALHPKRWQASLSFCQLLWTGKSSFELLSKHWKYSL